MLRWALYILALPVLLFLGATQAFRDHPVAPMNVDVTSALVVPVATPVAGAVAVPVPTIGEDADQLGALVTAAKQWLGVPYLWGGCTAHGVDCSCFTQHVYAALGINVPRTTVTQVAVYVPVAREALRVGDSLFFNNTCTDCGPNPTHVGLYLGNGLMIDAGDPVKIEPVYWSKFAEAGRPRGL